MELICKILYFILVINTVDSVTEEDHGVKYANKCEGKKSSKT